MANYLSGARSSLKENEKKPHWQVARYRELDGGELAVIAPLYREGTYVKVSEKNG